MSTVRIAVGFTQPNYAANYFPMSDGWREGAETHRVYVNVELPTVDDPERIVEAVFIATNAPQAVIDGDRFAKPIHDAIVQRKNEAAGAVGMACGDTEDYAWTNHYRSVSVGDTVSLYVDNGRFVRTYVCDRVGWVDLKGYGHA